MSRHSVEGGRERLARMPERRVKRLRAAILATLEASGPVHMEGGSLAREIVKVVGWPGSTWGPDSQDVVAVRNLLEREGLVRRFEDRRAHRAASSPGSWWMVELVGRDTQSAATEAVDAIAARVLDGHLLQGPRPGQCRCGWGDGSDVRTLGRSHSVHVVEQLRAAGVLREGREDGH